MLLSITDILHWLENTNWAIGIRQSLWLYPALEIVHLTGIVVLVGAAFMFDLRLLGFSKNLSVYDLSRHLLPWSQSGLLLIIPSGILLFMTNSETLGTDLTFSLKMILLILAAINALVFHKWIFKHQINSEAQGKITLSSKLSALISIMAWIAILTAAVYLPINFKFKVLRSRGLYHFYPDLFLNFIALLSISGSTPMS